MTEAEASCCGRAHQVVEESTGQIGITGRLTVAEVAIRYLSGQTETLVAKLKRGTLAVTLPCSDLLAERAAGVGAVAVRHDPGRDRAFLLSASRCFDARGGEGKVRNLFIAGGARRQTQWAFADEAGDV